MRSLPKCQEHLDVFQHCVDLIIRIAAHKEKEVDFPRLAL